MKIFAVAAALVACLLQANAQGGFCEYNTETARCVPSEIDAAAAQDYLAFVDVAARCIADTAAAPDGRRLAGCATEASDCVSVDFLSAMDDPQATQSLCLPANHSASLPLTDFLELSDAYTLCSDSESVTPACLATRVAYYSALGCTACGETEQELLVGFNACGEFAEPAACAAAQPRGLGALPGRAAVTRVEEVAGPAPEVMVNDMVEEDRLSIRRRAPRRARPADPPRLRRMRRRRPTDPPRSRRSRASA